MKKAISLIGVMVVLLSFLCGCTKRVEIGEIQSFYFRCTEGAMPNAYAEYTLELTDGVYTASIKPRGVPEEGKWTCTVDREFAESLEALLSENEVGKWNGFQKSDKRVADGKAFNLSMKMSGGTTLTAHGYMRWPKNYQAVKAGVEALFGELQNT